MTESYHPLSYPELKVGMKFGPISFSVKEASHEKSKHLLEGSDEGNETRITTPYLFPSEMWGWARVMSRYFGRLNEVAVSGATWRLHGTALPGETLRSDSEIVAKYQKRGLSFARIRTTTRNSQGKLLLESKDDDLLLHDAPKPFYVERGMTKEQPAHADYRRKRRVYFRYDWNPAIWKNNIHTDAYAQSCGYERGLPEFIMYMDWIFATQLESLGEQAYSGLEMKLEKILPIYENEQIRILGIRNRSSSDVFFYRGNQERVVAKTIKS